MPFSGGEGPGHQCPGERVSSQKPWPMPRVQETAHVKTQGFPASITDLEKNDEAAATSQWEGLAMTHSIDGSRPNRGPILPFPVKER
jgi:hypothetical protein